MMGIFIVSSMTYHPATPYSYLLTRITAAFCRSPSHRKQDLLCIHECLLTCLCGPVFHSAPFARWHLLVRSTYIVDSFWATGLRHKRYFTKCLNTRNFASYPILLTSPRHYNFTQVRFRGRIYSPAASTTHRELFYLSSPLAFRSSR